MRTSTPSAASAETTGAALTKLGLAPTTQRTERGDGVASSIRRKNARVDDVLPGNGPCAHVFRPRAAPALARARDRRCGHVVGRHLDARAPRRDAPGAVDPGAVGGSRGVPPRAAARRHAALA